MSRNRFGIADALNSITERRKQRESGQDKSDSSESSVDDSDIDINYAPESESDQSDSDQSDVDSSSENHEPNLEVNDKSNEDERGSEDNAGPSVKPKRLKKARPDIWKRNRWKKARASGEEHETHSGKKVSPKIPKPCNDHYAKCKVCKKSVQVTEDQRSAICNNFWGLNDQNRRRDFICHYVRKSPVSQRSTTKGIRSSSCQYFLQIDHNEIQVCQLFFRSTLCISNKMIFNSLSKENAEGSYNGTDGRGHQAPSNKMPEEECKSIIDHIESYPTVDPHYVRKDSTKKYLASDLNKSKMYDHYCSKMREMGKKPRSKMTFYRVLDDHFPNLGFHKPKKDQCATCTKFQNLEGEAKEAFQLEYEAHLNRKTESAEAKKMDKEKAKSNLITHRSLTYDLQSVLYTPCSEVSTLYYKRKLATYNFTIFEEGKPGKGYCYVWTETDGNRGSVEIASCLMDYLKSLPITVKEITMYSDTCGGQNRNQFVAAALLHCAKFLGLDVIEQKYLESGHTYMEVDSMHACIERAKKGKTVSVPEEWYGIIASAKKQHPYLVKKMAFNDFYDVKPLAESARISSKKDNLKETVHWLKIKILRYEKAHPSRIYFKYGYSENEFRFIDLDQVGTRRSAAQSIRATEFRLKPAYSDCLPISEAKRKDLLELCKSGAIPERYHMFYEGLNGDPTVRDALPEPDIDESDNEVEF